MSSRSVLVIGTGAREHALCYALAKAPSVRKVIAAPGNAGIARTWPTHPLGSDENALFTLVEKEAIDLVVIGPEAPLVSGLVDRLRSRGILAFGPSTMSAQLEGSKSFMKEFCRETGIPTSPYRIFSSAHEAHEHVNQLKTPPVIKADGLCSGKGVVVANSSEQAHQAIDDMLVHHSYGDAGSTIVVEDRIEGREASVQALCDGEHLILLPAAQDHKRLMDGDKGPNTGGMGAYAPAPLVTQALEQRVRSEILLPTVRALRSRGYPFRGLLYAGIMVTPSGTPMLLEFNVRFGDPETQAVLPLLDGDLAEALYGCAIGDLAKARLRPKPGLHAASIVIAAAGYPLEPRHGATIQGLDEAQALPNVSIFHAGTKRVGSNYVVSGGRVLSVVGTGTSLDQAIQCAYDACKLIKFDGMQMRSDVGGRV